MAASEAWTTLSSAPSLDSACSCKQNRKQELGCFCFDHCFIARSGTPRLGLIASPDPPPLTASARKKGDLTWSALLPKTFAALAARGRFILGGGAGGLAWWPLAAFC